MNYYDCRISKSGMYEKAHEVARTLLKVHQEAGDWNKMRDVHSQMTLLVDNIVQGEDTFFFCLLLLLLPFLCITILWMVISI